MKPSIFKKLIVMVLLFTSILSVKPALAAPTVILNGQQLSFDVPPVIDNDRTLVPLATIFRALGANVQWDEPTQTVTTTKDGTEIKLILGRVDAYVNGTMVTLSTPARAIDGRTMVPLAFVSTALGAEINWDEDTQTVIINVLSCGGPPLTCEVKVHYIDVGQGDSIYIQLPEHTDILIDGGNVADGPAVVNYLKSQGVDDIELMIATHPHEDHIGGLPAVLEAFKVDEIIDSGKTADSKIYKTYAAAAQTEGCTWEHDNYQTINPWGPLKFEILTGNQTWSDVNNYSVVTRLDDGDIHFLFEGDAQEQAEAALQGDISAQVLKVGNHGSTTSTNPYFLARVKPEIAVISVGTENTYANPNQVTLEKPSGAGLKVYRTDLNGTVVVSTDGETYEVITEN
ncbi:MAG TPA: stalk domain-containing protein [Syntrophomonadaceae bacterium]|nr:stalk domain-containing protein [Syntrophomonadaceae bacterium]